MTGKVFILGLLLLCVITDAKEKSGLTRKPSCPDTDEILACPMNMAPVCGTDGNTYANECALCVERQLTKVDIQITKDDSC